MAMEDVSQPSPVERRTYELAVESGERAAQYARDFLQPCIEDEVITEDIVDKVAESKRIKAIEDYTRERTAGLHNDKKSIGPGLTVWVKRIDPERLEAFQNPGEDKQRPTYSPEITQIEQDDGTTVYKVRLPEGTYKLVYDETQIFFSIARHPEDYDYSTNTWKTYAPHIMRIEGDHGELWVQPTTDVLDL